MLCDSHQNKIDVCLSKARFDNQFLACGVSQALGRLEAGFYEQWQHMTAYPMLLCGIYLEIRVKHCLEKNTYTNLHANYSIVGKIKNKSVCKIPQRARFWGTWSDDKEVISLSFLFSPCWEVASVFVNRRQLTDSRRFWKSRPRAPSILLAWN